MYRRGQLAGLAESFDAIGLSMVLSQSSRCRRHAEGGRLIVIDRGFNVLYEREIWEGELG
jgi:hypothetical protein